MRITTAPLVLMLLAACGGSKDADQNAATANGDDEVPATMASSDGQVDLDAQASAFAELSACREGLTDAELGASLLLAYDLDASVHELIACGGLTVQIAIGLVTGVVGMVVDDDDVMPAGLQFQGQGVYLSRSSLGASTMDMRVRLYERSGEDYVLVEEDLFERDNYLTHVRVEAGASADVEFDIRNPLDTTVSGDASLALHYEQAGPWAKLLGLGDPPPNPIEVTDVTDIDPDFGSIYLETEVDIHDVKGDSDIQLTVKTPLVRLVDLFDGGALAYEVTGLTASNADLRQTLTLESWDVRFVEHATLTGSTQVRVESPARRAASYGATLAYDHSAFAAIDFRCAN